MALGSSGAGPGQIRSLSQGQPELRRSRSDEETLAPTYRSSSSRSRGSSFGDATHLSLQGLAPRTLTSELRRVVTLSRPRGRSQTFARVHPRMWCVTRKDLDIFEQEVRDLWEEGGIPDDPNHPHSDLVVGPTIYQVNEHYIKPTTAVANTSWALMRHPLGLECDVFVTHCWSEGVFEFTSKLRRMWPHGAQNLYCCFLSNPQNSDIGELLGDDPYASPFALALQSSRYFLVLPNHRVSIYTRLWCVFEMHLARQHGLAIRLPTHPGNRPAAKAVLPGLWILVMSTSLMYALCHVLFVTQSKELTDNQVRSLVALSLCLVPLLALAINFAEHYGGMFLTTRVLWATITAMGVLSGFHLYFVVNVTFLRRVSFTWWKPSTSWTACILIPHYLMIFMCFSVITHRLVDQALREEGTQLQHASVRNATCTNPEDEASLRRIIGGMEDELDSTIEILMAAGKYDEYVAWNLNRGIAPQRILYGINTFGLMASWASWFMVVADVICVRASVNCPEGVWTVLLWWLMASSFIITWAFHCIGDSAIFASDVLLWSGVGIFEVNYINIWLVINPTICTAIQACIAVAAFLGLAHFYCRPAPKTQSMMMECKFQWQVDDTEGSEDSDSERNQESARNTDSDKSSADGSPELPSSSGSQTRRHSSDRTLPRRAHFEAEGP